MAKGWIIQETANEKEAYKVTIEVLSHSKHSPEDMFSAKFMKEIY